MRAESEDSGDWGGAELALLQEQGRAFRRVGPAAIPDAGELVREVVGGLFGLRADAGGRYAVAPWLPEGWRSLALRRARCHRTVLDIEARPRAEWVTVRLAVSFGPPIAIAVSLRNVPAVSRAVVDGVELEGDRAIFTASGEHEAMFFHGGSSA